MIKRFVVLSIENVVLRWFVFSVLVEVVELGR